MVAIPTNVYANADLRLRVWFNDGANGFQQLSPDQRLTPHGYLADGSVTNSKIADAAVSSAKLAPNLTLAGTTTGTLMMLPRAVRGFIV